MNCTNALSRLPQQAIRLLRQCLAGVAMVATMVGVAHAQTYANITAGGAFAPGVYGQISIGNNLRPPVWNAEPVVVGRPAWGAPVVYLYAPPEHQRNWGRHCARYRACGHPVHFVRVEHHNRWWEHHAWQHHNTRRHDRHDRYDRYDDRYHDLHSERHRRH